MSKIGLFGKYLLAKADSSDLNPSAKYFVLRYDTGAEHGAAGRSALAHYCAQIAEEMPELSEELMAALSAETQKVTQALLGEVAS